MLLEEFERDVRHALGQARDSLGAIEQHVREEGDVPALMAASRSYARFCLYAREFLQGVALGRPLPRRFGQRVAEVRRELEPHRATLEAFPLHPTEAELDRLRDAALFVPERA